MIGYRLVCPECAALRPPPRPDGRALEVISRTCSVECEDIARDRERALEAQAKHRDAYRARLAEHGRDEEPSE